MHPVLWWNNSIYNNYFRSHAIKGYEVNKDTYNPSGFWRRWITLHDRRHVIVNCRCADWQFVLFPLRLFLFPLYRTLGFWHDTLGPHADSEALFQPAFLTFPPHIHVHFARVPEFAYIHRIFGHAPPEEPWNFTKINHQGRYRNKSVYQCVRRWKEQKWRNSFANLLKW